MTFSGIFLIKKMQRLLNQRGKLPFNLIMPSRKSRDFSHGMDRLTMI